MRRSMTRLLGLAFVANLLVSGMAPADPYTPKPGAHHARWEWTVSDSEGKTTTGTFSAWEGGAVTLGKAPNIDRIGSWSNHGKDEVHAVIEKGRLAGTMKVKLVPQPKDKPPKYEGELVHKDGKKEKLEVELFASSK